MGAMLRQAIAGVDVLGYPIAALVIFVTVFAAIVGIAMSKKRDEIDRLAALPLSEGKDA